MTLVIRSPVVAQELAPLQTVAGIAVAEAIRSTLGIDAYVRWPNDVLVNNKKVAGVLIETRFAGNSPSHVLIGFGVNANFRSIELGPVLEAISTTLFDECGHQVEREALICKILARHERLCEELWSRRTGELLQRLRLVECSRGKKVVVETATGRLRGIFEEYESLSSFRIRGDDGTKVSAELDSVHSVQYPSS